MQNAIAEWVLYGLLLAGLLLEAVIDIKKQKIWIPVIIIEIPFLLGLNYFIGRGGMLLWVAFLGAGFVFYLLSIVTGEQIGKGDAFLFAMTGAGMGFFENIRLLYFTFLIAFFAAVFLWLIKKKGRNYRMPMAPFVLAAFCLLLTEKLAFWFCG